MTTISLNEAQATLSDLIHRLAPGEVVTITENDRPVARIVSIPAIQPRPPRPRPPVTGIPKAGQLAVAQTVSCVPVRIALDRRR
jgi:prevent-host-death family protein